MIKNLVGITTFPDYGQGPDQSALDGIHFWRAFVDNLEFSEPGGPVRFSPNVKGRKIDDWMQMVKDKGVDLMWCAQGRLKDQDVAGKANKVMPIVDGADAMDPANWADYAELCAQIVIRYWKNTSGDRANVYKDPSNSYFSSPDLVGHGSLGSIQIGNEVDFPKAWHNGTRTLTATEYAVCFKACYERIRLESEDVPIVAGSIISPNLDWMSEFLEAFGNLYEGDAPSDFYLSWHWYMRQKNQDQDWGDDFGASPEFVDAHNFAKRIDDLVKAYGLLGHYCTETGWADDPDPRSKKQAVPPQEGYTLSESVAVLAIRTVLAWGSLPHFKGVTFWHCADGYDGHPYWFGGYNYKRTDPSKNDWNIPHPEAGIVDDWLPKPQLNMLNSFIDLYGSYSVENSTYLFDDPVYSCALVGGDKKYDFFWTDGKNYTDVDDTVFTPMPSAFEDESTPPVDEKVIEVTRIENFMGREGNTIDFDTPMKLIIK